jgi:hypothetical protein
MTIKLIDASIKAKYTRAYVFSTEALTKDEQRDIVRKACIKLGVKVTSQSLKWNRKAGCSCGCSPGFVLDKLVTDDSRHESIGCDIYIDV